MERGSFCPYPDTVEEQFSYLFNLASFAFYPLSYLYDVVYITDIYLIYHFSTLCYELCHSHFYLCQHLHSSVLLYLPDLFRFQTVVPLLYQLEFYPSVVLDLRSSHRRLLRTSEEALSSLTLFVRLIRILALYNISLPYLVLPLSTFTDLSPLCLFIIAIAVEIRRH